MKDNRQHGAGHALVTVLGAVCVVAIIGLASGVVIGVAIVVARAIAGV